MTEGGGITMDATILLLVALVGLIMGWIIRGGE